MKLLDKLFKSYKKIEKIEPEGVEVCVFDDNNKEPLRTLMHHIRCPKCGETHGTDGLPYLNCSCGFNAKIIYSDDTKIIGLQDTINCLNIRINYMLATGEPKEKVLPFIAELKELVDALEFGTTYTELKTQKWRENALGLKDSIMYSLR